ncbi:MAG: hypothetical protein OEZ43_01845 [Gammaproteobacteria bacterium]|nr:hypothetical protein [Gammaproteobacteria bacterium]
MARAALKTFSLTDLKMEAGSKNLSMAKAILDVASRLPNFPIHGSITDVIQVLLDDLVVSRHYWEAKLGMKLSVKIGDTIAIDNYSNSAKSKKLVAAQAILLAPELELADDTLTYDAIRHNYAWKGRLIELRESMMPSTKDSFCVIHPDEDFIPVSILGNVRVIRSCTQKDPNYSNEVNRTNMTHEQRQALIHQRRQALEKRV